jgi:hypothetical protein
MRIIGMTWQLNPEIALFPESAATDPDNFVVFDTIPIMAVWPVSVSYQHSVVGILVGITDYISLPS